VVQDKLPKIVKTAEDIKTVLSAFGVPFEWIQECTGVADTYTVYIDRAAEWDFQRADYYHRGRMYLNTINHNGVNIIFII
jgi:hypothetical protein